MNTANEHVTTPTEAPRPSVWKLGGMSWKTLALRVWLELYAGTLLTHAAALSFYFLLALFPLLLFLITLLGFFTQYGTELRAELLSFVSRVVPATASVLFYRTVDEVSREAGGGKLSFGLVSAFLVASSGIVAIGEALNAMYGVRESRPWWRVRAVALGLTGALSLLVITALLLILFGGEIAERAALYFNQSGAFASLWLIAQVPIIIVFLLFTFAVIYYFAPNLYEQKWYWITPGSVTGVALWLLVSFLFRIYLRHFDTYSIAYGSLGALIVLVLWFYLTGVAILLGGKINAEIESAAAEAGIPGAKHHGEKESYEKTES
jgi:membrane protein